MSDDLIQRLSAHSKGLRKEFDGGEPVSLSAADLMDEATEEIKRLREALEFYADPSHWRTADAGGSLVNRGFGLGYHRTDPDGMIEVLRSNCGQWVPSKHMVHGGHWQADAGSVARFALKAKP